MATFLYVIPFQNKKYFKIGISKNKGRRLRTLANKYALDFQGAYFAISDEERDLQILEKSLLQDSIESEVSGMFGNCTGRTEIRRMEAFEGVVADLRYKESRVRRVSVKKGLRVVV